MILGYYAGYLETDLDKSFRYVAWGSQYGVGIQFDPIFGCISHFLRRARQRGIWITTPFERVTEKINLHDLDFERFPYLFVLAGESGEVPLARILQYVEAGSNLVVLSSEDIELRAAEHRETDKLKEFYQQFYELSGTNSEYRKQQATISRGKGNILFVDATQISDAQIEPGPFGGWSLKKQIAGLARIDEEIQRITTFSIPCVDCQISNVPATWPRGESLVVQLSFLNRSSSEVRTIEASLQSTPDFEPLSLIDFEIESLPSSRLVRETLEFRGSEPFSVDIYLDYQGVHTTPVVFVPQKNGIVHNPFKIRVKYGNIAREIPLDPIQLEILEPLPKLVRAVKPQSVDWASALERFERYFAPVVESSTLFELMRTDPASVVQKARQIGEYIVRSIAKRTLERYDPNADFYSLNQVLYKQRVISDKAKGYIETVRYIGNLASHPSGNKFTKEDAVLVCQSLVLFLYETTEKSLLD